MASYAEKLKDPRWQKKRLEILNRDQFACLCCGSKIKTLHIHHRYYLKVDPWDYPNDALDTLCESCHAYVEGLKKPKQQVESIPSTDPWYIEEPADSWKYKPYHLMNEEERREWSKNFDDGFSTDKPF